MMGKTLRKIDWLLIVSIVVFAAIIASLLALVLLVLNDKTQKEIPRAVAILFAFGPGLFSFVTAPIGLRLFRRRGSKPKLWTYFAISVFAFLIYGLLGWFPAEYFGNLLYRYLQPDNPWPILFLGISLGATVVGLVVALIGRLFTKPAVISSESKGGQV